MIARDIYSKVFEFNYNFPYDFRGVTPAEAEMNYLNTAKMLDLYGVDIHTVMVSRKNIQICSTFKTFLE